MSERVRGFIFPRNIHSRAFIIADKSFLRAANPTVTRINKETISYNDIIRGRSEKQ